MFTKELRKFSRRKLVDIIYQMKKNEQQQKEEIAALKAALEDKRIRISEAGSISDAAVSLTDLLATAQSAADLYLDEIAAMKAETEMECARIIEEAKAEADRILAEGKEAYADLCAVYQADYEKLKELQDDIFVLEEIRQLRY